MQETFIQVTNNFGITENSYNQLYHLFKHFDAIEQVIIYGSRAKGNFREGSDIDLTLIGKNIDMDLLMQISTKIDDLPIPYKVDLSIYTKIDSPDLIEHIKRVGKIFYKP